MGTTASPFWWQPFESADIYEKRAAVGTCSTAAKLPREEAGNIHAPIMSMDAAALHSRAPIQFRSGSTIGGLPAVAVPAQRHAGEACVNLSISAVFSGTTL